jgi:hypothetical protein
VASHERLLLTVNTRWQIMQHNCIATSQHSNNTVHCYSLITLSDMMEKVKELCTICSKRVYNIPRHRRTVHNMDYITSLNYKGNNCSRKRRSCFLCGLHVVRPTRHLQASHGLEPGVATYNFALEHSQYVDVSAFSGIYSINNE